MAHVTVRMPTALGTATVEAVTVQRVHRQTPFTALALVMLACGLASGDDVNPPKLPQPTRSAFLHVDLDARGHARGSLLLTGFEPIDVAFGYRPSDHPVLLAGLAGLLLLPIALTLWLRRRALAAPTEDRAAVWFAYNKRLQFLLLASWIGWAVTILLPDVRRPLEFLTAGRPEPFREAVSLLLFFGPPMLVHMVCAALSATVHRQVRALGWTRGELARRVFWTEAAFVLPISLGFIGLAALRDDATRMAALSFVAALVSWSWSRQRLAAAMQTALHAVTEGPLRNRVFEMAERAGVRLNQVFVLDASKTLEANAAAIRGIGRDNNVMLTDYLLRHLSPREVDTVIGHELSHLKHRHGGHPVVVFVVICIAVMGGLWLLTERGPIRPRILGVRRDSRRRRGAIGLEQPPFAAAGADRRRRRTGSGRRSRSPDHIAGEARAVEPASDPLGPLRRGLADAPVHAPPHRRGRPPGRNSPGRRRRDPRPDRRRR